MKVIVPFIIIDWAFLTKLLKKCATSPKMTKDESLNRESFIEKVQPTMMDGMMTFIMVTLLSMMLLL